jgi:hypothetical protein
MINRLTLVQMNVANPLSQETDSIFMAVVEPVAATLAVIVIIVITFYMSNLKHDMLDASLNDRPYKIKRRKVYTRLLKLLPLKIRIGLLGN